MMESSSDSTVESDKQGIVPMRLSDDSWSTTSGKLKRICCTNKIYLIPLIISILSIFLVLGTIFGFVVKYHELTSMITHQKVLLEAFELKSTASASEALAHRSPVLQSAGSAGSTYIHWGKKTCGADSSLVYSGFGAGSAAGTVTRGGGGAKYLCMPPNPEYNKFDMSNDTAAHSWLYSTEYMSFDLGIFPRSVHGHNVACSVCHAPRSAKTMIPAKRSCPIGWTKEYEGYLMSGYVRNMKTSYECVDTDPDVIGGTQNVTGGASLYFVSGYCGEYGGLSHCPRYVTARELTCVICTK
ncbi:uncharacterized protein [Watersipora subatra]|uniref:uncharacterized protein n=1 Tax=Watersipora subatra TaxID=2589382 RepID=UPI00355AD15D